ncbi:MAG: hypothetical protein Q7T82_04470 [Armatimonadota bacterium]|nr:hypothetical protein [Armatimonadota bacterium]
MTRQRPFWYQAGWGRDFNGLVSRSALPTKEWWPKLALKLKGHYQYYGISGNYRGVERYHYAVVRMVYKWLNRRSQRRSFDWPSFSTYLERHPLPRPRIYHNRYCPDVSR